MAGRKIEPWLQRSHIELKTYVKDRGEKFIDAESRRSKNEAILIYTTEPVYVKFIKFATDKFQNIRARHWDSRLPERRNEVREKFLKPLENAIRDGLHEWKASERERKLMEAATVSVTNAIMKLSFTEKKSALSVLTSSVQQRPVEWKPVEWKPTEWYVGSSQATQTTSGRSETRPGQGSLRNHMNRSSESEFKSDFSFRVGYSDGSTFRFGFGRRF